MTIRKFTKLPPRQIDIVPPRIIGFIGPSGSGKSHRAAWVAGEQNIDFILDDGILIKSTSVIAGVSAKKEKTKIGSVKRALLTDIIHANSIRNAIKTYNIGSILVLGTSKKMVEAIAKKLSVDKISKIIHITDVANEDEISKALYTRKFEGKHVIPVPTFEIKKHFSGYLLDPLQIFRKKGQNYYLFVGEKSVVRPTFSYLGNYTISDYTIHQLCEHVISTVKEVSRVYRLKVEGGMDGIQIYMEIIMIYGNVIGPVIDNVRRKLKTEIERLTSINVVCIDIFVRSLVMSECSKIDG